MVCCGPGDVMALNADVCPIPALVQVLTQLSAKVQETVYCQMSDLQLELYSSAVNSSRRKLATLKEGQQRTVFVLIHPVVCTGCRVVNSCSSSDLHCV